jgi:glutamate/aspartate transport system substrate-binding protein
MPRLRRSALTALTALALFSSPGSGWAQSPTSTLEKIGETGVIRIGYSAESMPFSYRTADGTVTGYSTELCLLIADRLKRQLGLPALAVEYVERTPSNRVAMLRDGQFDIECVASTNNAERRKSVAFSYSHFVTGTQYVSLKKNNLRTVDDLAGHTVAATSGTINIGKLNAINRERGLHIAVMPVESHHAAFKMVAEGRAAAFVMDGILLAAMIANSETPELFALSTGTLGPPEPYGLMVRRDDHEFKRSVNGALQELYASGQIEEIYNRWFMAPIAPNNINMRLPVSTELRKVFSDPASMVEQ